MNQFILQGRIHTIFELRDATFLNLSIKRERSGIDLETGRLKTVFDTPDIVFVGDKRGPVSSFQRNDFVKVKGVLSSQLVRDPQLGTYREQFPYGLSIERIKTETEELFGVSTKDIPLSSYQFLNKVLLVGTVSAITSSKRSSLLRLLLSIEGQIEPVEIVYFPPKNGALETLTVGSQIAASCSFQTRKVEALKNEKKEVRWLQSAVANQIRIL